MTDKKTIRREVSNYNGYKIKKEDISKIVSLYQFEKFSANEIGKMFNCSGKQIRIILKLNNIPNNKKSDYYKKNPDWVKNISETKKRLYADGKIKNYWKGRANPNTFERNLKKNPMQNQETINKLKDTITFKIKGGLRVSNSETLKNLYSKGLIKKSKTCFNKGCKPWNKLEFRQPYSYEFNDSLKEKIRERDCNICQHCLIFSEKKKLEVHHIDYNKNNNSNANLIGLCKSCHAKTTNGDRNLWKDYFVQKQALRFLLDKNSLLIYENDKLKEVMRN